MSEVEHRRPLSPHLQVFRPVLTMVMSIVHRITGDRALRWRVAARLLPCGGGERPGIFRDGVSDIRLDHRPDRPVRVHLGSPASSARRNSPRDLGCRLRHGSPGARISGAGDSDRRHRADRHRLGARLHDALSETEHTIWPTILARCVPRSAACVSSAPRSRARSIPGTCASRPLHLYRCRSCSSGLVASLVGKDYEGVRALFRNGFIPATVMILFILASAYHMMLGMQTIIEDYVHDEMLKTWSIMAQSSIFHAGRLCRPFCGAETQPDLRRAGAQLELTRSR